MVEPLGTTFRGLAGCRQGNSGSLGGLPQLDRQPSISEDLATVEVPVVCMQGARSPDSMFRLVRSLAAAIPTARTHRIEGAGHAAAFDATTNFVQLIADTISSGETDLCVHARDQPVVGVCPRTDPQPRCSRSWCWCRTLPGCSFDKQTTPPRVQDGVHQTEHARAHARTADTSRRCEEKRVAVRRCRW